MDEAAMDEAVRRYVESIPPEHRALFDRVQALILEVHPDADVVISYTMPTYRVGRRRLHVATWAHGVSLYGWSRERDGGFTERRPELVSGKGTIRLRPEDSTRISDDELRDLIRSALGA
jgi:uncharacterized protein YdhG (YjbR/CyaY superfamily)